MLKFAISVFPLGAAMDMMFNGATMVMTTQSQLLAMADHLAGALLPL